MTKSLWYKNTYKGEELGPTYSQDSERRTLYRELVKDMVANVDQHKEKKVLEVTCGKGQGKELLPERWDYTGLTLRDSEVKYGEDNGINIIKGDMMEIPFEDNMFDVVYCVHGLEYVSSQDVAFNEMYRVLKPGGHLFIVYHASINETEHDTKTFFCILNWYGLTRFALQVGANIIENGKINRKIENRISNHFYIFQKR